jgi:hypothetical protein
MATAGDAGVAGRAEQLQAVLLGARESAYDRVLATAADDDEDLYRDLMKSSTGIAASVS